MNVFSSLFSRGISRRALLQVCGLCLLTTTSLFLLAACIGSGSSTPSNSQVALQQLHWCDKPFIVFSDQKNATTPSGSTSGTPGIIPTITTTPGATTTSSTTITDWSKVKPLLNFTLYLPQSLPSGSCLVSVTGTVHDPIFGSSFTISYLLNNHSSVNVAEAPLRAQNPDFQCSTAPSPTGGKATPASKGASSGQFQLCSGARAKTSVTFAAQGNNDYMKQFYNNLKANVNWMPATTK